MSAFADHVTPNCAPVLASQKFSAGDFIVSYLKEQGELRGATQAGLIEIWTASGETILSRLYFSYDDRPPISPEEMKSYVSRLSRRANAILRVNAWSVGIQHGGIVNHSVPVDML